MNKTFVPILYMGFTYLRNVVSHRDATLFVNIVWIMFGELLPGGTGNKSCAFVEYEMIVKRFANGKKVYDSGKESAKLFVTCSTMFRYVSSNFPVTWNLISFLFSFVRRDNGATIKL